MNRKKDERRLIGQKFGRLLIESVHRTVNPSTGDLSLILCDCKCDCGKRKLIRWSNIQGGNISSCGCYQIECIKKRQTKHGHAKHNLTEKQTPTYRSWTSMVRRCLSKTSKDYPHYGGRGISIEHRWKKFENFFQDMGNRPEGTTLGRIDNNKGYNKNNCEWQSVKIQNSNMRKTIRIKYKGKQYCLADLAKLVGLNYTTLHRRIKNNIPIEQAVLPVKKKVIWIAYKGKTYRLKELAELVGLKYTTLKKRICVNKLPIEEAILPLKT